MVGYGGGAMNDSAVAAAETFSGRPMDLGIDSLAMNGTLFPPYTSSNGRKLGIVLDFPMLAEPWDGPQYQSISDMSLAANGAYDDTYTQIAQAMAGFGDPPVVCRPGIEPNHSGWPWSAPTGNTHNATPGHYIATFKRIAQKVRNVNPNILIEWSTIPQPTMSGETGYTPLDYWVGAYDPVNNPGGADVVSMDVHEGSAGSDFWGGQFGLYWLVTFAQENGVKVALSDASTGLSTSPGEGRGCPCSNDAVLMQRLIDWINGLPPGLFTDFVFTPWSSDDLLSSGNAGIQQVWRQNWGGTHFAGTWWHGPKVPSQP